MTQPDRDFERMITQGYSLITLSILYYLPDYRTIINEFVWQTLDVRPRFPRVMQFLDFWRRDIDAVIKEIRLCDASVLRASEVRWINGNFLIN